MTEFSPETVTRILEAAREGDTNAMERLFPLVYEELRQRAHWQRLKWHGDLTLNTTGLVHEAYLKLVDQSKAEWKDRAHFLSVGAKAIRHILIDYARGRRAKKRGGDIPKFSLEEMQQNGFDIIMSNEKADELISLEEALVRLEKEDAREAKVIECKFFGGMTIEETAIALSISERTVKRDWAMAQAWLRRELANES